MIKQTTMNALKANTVPQVNNRMSFDFLVVLGTNLILLMLGFLTGALVARLLGPVGRGQIAAIELWGLFLMNLGSLGVPQALLYYSGRYREKAGSYISSAWLIMLPLSTIWIVIGYFSLPVLLANKEASVVNYARLFLLILPMAYISRASWALQGLKRFASWGLFRVHKPFLYAISVLLLGILGIARPETITLVLIALSAIGPLLVLVLLRRSDIQLRKPSCMKIKELLTYGYRSVLGTLPEELNTRLDQVVIAIWLTDMQLGYYVVAVSWSLILAPFMRAIGSVLLPHVAGKLDLQEQMELLAQSTRNSLFLIMVATIALLIITPFVFPFVFGDEFLSSVPVALMLLIASSFYHLKNILSDGLRGLGFPEATAYAEITSLVVTVITLILLVPKTGIMGAAISSLLAYFLSVGLLTLFTLRKTSLQLVSLYILTSRDVAHMRENLRKDVRWIVSKLNQKPNLT
jgi:O-antigen/teichoic acid export membrane protein